MLLGSVKYFSPDVIFMEARFLLQSDRHDGTFPYIKAHKPSIRPGSKGGKIVLHNYMVLLTGDLPIDDTIIGKETNR